MCPGKGALYQTRFVELFQALRFVSGRTCSLAWLCMRLSPRCLEHGAIPVMTRFCGEVVLRHAPDEGFGFIASFYLPMEMKRGF